MARVVYFSLLPDYLKLDDGTDFDWIVEYKYNAFGKWHIYTDISGIPISFNKDSIPIDSIVVFKDN